jgi:adenylate kinase
LNQEVGIFIFIGPPGAGKGSLASFCIKKFGWLQISTGNLCRKHIAEQTKIGKEIDLIIKSGKLINDDLITSMVSDWLQENATKTSGIIFDGYPRTVVQAENFSKILRNLFPKVQEKIVHFVISDDVVINRLCCRFVCQNKECQAVYSLSDVERSNAICKECGGMLGRRTDDEESSVKKRLAVYHKHEQELMDFYYNNGTPFIELDAAKPLNDVFVSFLQNIDEQI